MVSELVGTSDPRSAEQALREGLRHQPTDEGLQARLGLILISRADAEGEGSFVAEARTLFDDLGNRAPALQSLGLGAVAARVPQWNDARRYFGLAAELLSWEEEYFYCWNLALELAFLPRPRNEAVAFLAEGASALADNESLRILLGVILEEEGESSAQKWLGQAAKLVGDPVEFESTKESVRNTLRTHQG